jgi:hypothetical protein
VIERAKVIKRKFKAYEVYHPLVDRTLVMVFEKSSTRTRLSFEAGMHQLGGAAIYLNTRDSQLGRGEPVEDAGQVMSPHVRHHHGAHLRPGHHRALRRQFARAGDQRPDQRTPPLPGAGRHLHLLRAPRFDRRQDRGLDRRRQQHAVLVAAGGRGVRLPPERVDPEGLRHRPGPGHDEELHLLREPVRRLPAPTWSTPTCGPAWATKRKTPSA